MSVCATPCACSSGGWRRGRDPLGRVVGAGFGGMVVLERSDRVGGVWNYNTYPGAACDVPSHLYSYGLSLPRFPNPFLMYGPNTFGARARRSTCSSARRATSRLPPALCGRAEHARSRSEPLPTIVSQRAARATAQHRLGHRGCSSWYVDEEGRDPTNWPGYTFEYRRRTTRIETEAYSLAPAG